MTPPQRRARGCVMALASLALALTAPPHSESQDATVAAPPAATSPPPASPRAPAPLFPIVVRDLWGYIDRQGQVVITPQHASLASVDQDWRVGQTLPRGYRPRAVDLFLAPSVRPESSAVVAVKSGGRWGFLDRREVLVSPRFDQVGLFEEGFAPVRTGERWGFVNTHGRLSVETRYQEVGDFRGGFAVVIDEGRSGVIDTTGRVVVRARFERVVPGDSMFHEGRLLVGTGGKKGFVRPDGTIAIPARFLDAGPFREGLAPVEMLTGHGFIDTTGGWVIPARYDAVEPFDRGLAWVRKVGVYGVIDRTGHFLVTPRFQEVSSFHGGEYAAVRREKMFGWIDRTGAWIGAPGPELARIDDTLRVVRMPEGDLAILVLPLRWIMTRIDADDLQRYSEGLAAVSRQGGPIGFVDTRGRMRIAPRFDRVDRFRAGLCRAVVGDTLGYIDPDGQWVWHSRVRGFGRRNATRPR